MQSEKVRFTKEKQTMLITLYGRAMQSRSQHPILRDPWAEEAIGRIDHDFASFKVGERAARMFACRAAQLDQWTRTFLADHPDATVLHLGCGMDSRIYRIAPPDGVRWFDVDYPDVIELRRRLYPARAGRHMIGSSLADPSWIEAAPRGGSALIVAEGVTMYLTAEIIKALLSALIDRFSSGWVAFDAHTPQIVRWTAKMGTTVRGTGATFRWGIDDPQEIKQIEPRLDLVAERSAHKLEGFAKMPWPQRAQVRLMDAIPALRIMRCLLYQFERG